MYCDLTFPNSFSNNLHYLSCVSSDKIPGLRQTEELYSLPGKYELLPNFLNYSGRAEYVLLGT